MPPHSDNPLIVLAYILAVLVGVPGIVALVKAVFFIAAATTKLDAVVDGLGALLKETREYQSGTTGALQGFEMSLYIVEVDVNALQERAEMPVRQYPDRRAGMTDRRHV